MSIFSIDDDLKKLTVRATASLDKIDAAVYEVNQLVVELRTELAAVKRGREAMGSTPPIYNIGVER
jgi:hypothetical protein